MAEISTALSHTFYSHKHLIRMMESKAFDHKMYTATFLYLSMCFLDDYQPTQIINRPEIITYTLGILKLTIFSRYHVIATEWVYFGTEL